MNLASLALLSLLALVGAAAAQVDIAAERFGVGSVYRPGDITAVRIALTWRGVEPRAVQIVWEVENADGDITEQTRTTVLNPGQTNARWLYGRPGPRTEPQTTFTIRVYAEDEGRRGAELGTQRFSPTTAAAAGSPIGLDQRLIGVLGEGRMGLEGFSLTLPTIPLAVASNELLRIASGLDARELPDRWEGLQSFEALIWSTPPPQQMGLDEADALREWIRRGGHLVIVLPQAGNPWGLGAAATHPLHDLLPSVGPRRVEGVPFARVVDLLSRSNELLNPRAATSIATWESDRLDRGWEPLMAIPAPRDATTGRAIRGADGLGGAIVALQRDLGFGRISLIGIDVNAANRLRLQAGAFPQPDAFWNRVLGGRSDAPNASDLVALEGATPPVLSRATTMIDTLGGGGLVAGRIAMSGEAAIGTLAALVLFIVYWVAAGPGGFGLLRARRLTHHAWLAFVATAAVFTVIAWLGSAALRQGNVRIQHVTFLDHVSAVGRALPEGEPQYQRGWSWFSAYLPGYGPTRVSVDGPPSVRNVLSSWMSPPAGTPQRFPNTDRYVIPFGSPADYLVPARATAVQMEARWLGTVESSWGSMPTALPDAPVVERIEGIATPSISVSGKLRHGLPAPLRQVVILHISSLRTPLRSDFPETDNRPAPTPQRSGELLNFGRIVIRPSWEPGETLDLERELYPDGPRAATALRLPRGGLAEDIRARYIEPLATTFGTPVEMTITADRARLYMDILSMFSLMPPPTWLTTDATRQMPRVPPRVMRTFGRDLDLGGWLSRPCIIILGVLEDAECPVPIRVDGSAPPSTGITYVRWICPLPVDAEQVIQAPRSVQNPAQADLGPATSPF